MPRSHLLKCPGCASKQPNENGVDDRLFKFFVALEKEMLSRDLIRTAARHGAIEMALSGVTLVVDMFHHEDEVRPLEGVGGADGPCR